MEDVLSKLVQHSVNYAIRSGIALTSSYAISSCTRLVKSVKGTEKQEIAHLQASLESKINIISPPIDMIELIAARGNTSLESALTLTKQIRMDIQDLGVRLNQAAGDEDRIQRKGATAKNAEQMALELKQIITDMKRLLARIEDAVPLLMLAITTSGASLSASLPASVSPSRLLQASTFLSAGDANYAAMPNEAVQVGPVFVLSVYMLFAAHTSRAQEEGVTDTTWKEVIRKGRVKLLRVPLSSIYDLPLKTDALKSSKQSQYPNATFHSSNIPSENKAFEFAYQLVIVEDLDDDRYHEEQGEPFDDVSNAGICEVIPIHEVSKIFYADTGKILKIGSDGEPNNPVLLLKRDVDAVPPRRMMNRQPTDEDHGGDLPKASPQSGQNTGALSQKHPPGDHKRRFPRDLDPEWIALEVYTEAADSEDEDEDEPDKLLVEPTSSPPPLPRNQSMDFLSSAISSLRLRNSLSPSLESQVADPESRPSQIARTIEAKPSVSGSYFPSSNLPALRTSLSLLELLVRLTALQQFQQASHLTIHDEFLNFFLSGSSSTGAGADSEYRQRVRRDARMRVGFDPYDESPLKPRGEKYIGEHRNNDQNWDTGIYEDDEPDWQPWNNIRRGSLNSSASPRTPASPSPSSRKQMQQRVGEQSMTSRSQQLRSGSATAYTRSPLGRSDSDSTLGTSPRTPALDADKSA